MIAADHPSSTSRMPPAGHDFYEEFLGLRKQFDLGWVASFRSPAERPSKQVESRLR